MSIGQLQEKGLTIKIQNNMCTVVHPEKGSIMEVSMSSSRMFVLIATRAPTSATCFKAELERESQLWHNHLGHLSYDGLKTLASKQIVNGLPTILVTQELCIHCLTGKQHQNSMSKKSLWRVSEKLQLIHANLCGLIRPSSNNNKKYFLSYIDDFSQKTWVYFLHDKVETFSLFKSFKSLVEKEVGGSIIYLRTDRGGELIPMHLKNSTKLKVYRDNQQQLTHLSRMELLRGKIEPS